jgi:endonuclease-3
MNIKERYKYIIAYFKENNPIAKTELKYDNAFELLVAVILSAQCTDKRVNLLTPSLMTQFPTAKLMSQASIEDIFSFIKTCSYPNNKAKHLLGMATMLTNEFNEIIPSDINELQKLPGVGRKTANVIASVKTPLESEKQLVKYISNEFIPIAHHWLILHGRYVCLARKPKCNECEISQYCKYFEEKLTTIK